MFHLPGVVVSEPVGQFHLLKRDLLPSVKDPVALDLMRSLKRMLDPKDILNPGKVL